MKGFSIGDKIKVTGEDLKLEGVLVEHPPQFLENTPFMEGKRLNDYPEYISIKVDDEIYLVDTTILTIEHA